LHQDEDVLDTWFSSWLWPIEVFKGISNPDNAEINYYYPTTTLVTGQDIIFFWVARMIMAGYEFKSQLPFKDVYFTGMVRDKQGRKMSKQLGNSPDLLGLIEQYGADAVRFGIMIASPAGNDILFDESALEQGRNFNNKLWNALKLVKMWEGRIGEKLTVDRQPLTEATNDEAFSVSNQGNIANEIKDSVSEIKNLASNQRNPASNEGNFVSNEGNSSNEIKNPARLEGEIFTTNFPISWFSSRLNQVKTEVEGLMEQFKLSEALKTIYSLVWDDFCSWYLEWVKPGFEQPISKEVYEKTVGFFEELMQLIHPFMPFVSEEIYHLLKDNKDDLCVKLNQPICTPDAETLQQGELLKQVITALRDARNKNQIKPKETIKLHIQTGETANYKAIESILSKQVNAASIDYTNNTVANTIVVAVETDKFYIESEKELDTTALKQELLKDLAHQQGFLQSVLKKLSNERFVQNARPDLIELERKKQADAEARIKTIEESLANI